MCLKGNLFNFCIVFGFTNALRLAWFPFFLFPLLSKFWVFLLGFVQSL